MLIAIIGENCVGKSTLASKINEKLNAKIYSGKDYLRLDKNPDSAVEKFKLILKDAVNNQHVIYLITEKEHLSFLPEGTYKIVLTADLDTIKERFKKRMRGNLPAPVEKMLETKHGLYDDLKCDLRLESGYDINTVLSSLNLND